MITKKQFTKVDHKDPFQKIQDGTYLVVIQEESGRQKFEVVKRAWGRWFLITWDL